MEEEELPEKDLKKIPLVVEMVFTITSKRLSMTGKAGPFAGSGSNFGSGTPLKLITGTFEDEIKIRVEQEKGWQKRNSGGRQVSVKVKVIDNRKRQTTLTEITKTGAF